MTEEMLYLVLKCLLVCLFFTEVACFREYSTNTMFSRNRLRFFEPVLASPRKVNDIESTGVVGQIVFKLTEGLSQFGSIFNQANGSVGQNNMLRGKKSLSSLATSLKEDYEKVFWATGDMNMDLYASNCTFSDPFSSFGGEGSTKRFKNNADSLGKLIISPKCKVSRVDVDAVAKSVSVEWSFTSLLSLPWRPVLSAAGITTHFINDGGKIIKYEERWKSKPVDVVLRLFKPSGK